MERGCGCSCGPFVGMGARGDDQLPRRGVARGFQRSQRSDAELSPIGGEETCGDVGGDPVAICSCFEPGVLHVEVARGEEVPDHFDRKVRSACGKQARGGAAPDLRVGIVDEGGELLGRGGSMSGEEAHCGGANSRIRIGERAGSQHRGLSASDAIQRQHGGPPHLG